MNKWICKSNDCICGCVVDSNRFEMTPHKCPFISTQKADWQEMVADLQPDLQDKQPDLQDKPLPKLTADVFDREDCPEDAKIAVVNKSGSACWGSFASAVPVFDGWGGNGDGEWKTFPGKWDATDWKNSLIERPAKLPEWCKVGEWVWNVKDSRYVMVKSITDKVLLCTKSKCTYYEELKDMTGNYEQTRLRPYNAEEMRGLVGKVVERYSSAYLVISYAHDDLATTVYIEGKYLSADNLLRDFTIAGQPCGKLEHMDNGEWVE